MKKLAFLIIILLSITAFSQDKTTEIGNNVYFEKEGNNKYVTFKYPDNNATITLAKVDNKIAMFLELEEDYTFTEAGVFETVVTFKKGNIIKTFTIDGHITSILKMVVLKVDIKDDPAFLNSFLSSEYIMIDMSGESYFFSLEESTKAYNFLKN
jgi:predicted transport protein